MKLVRYVEHDDTWKKYAHVERHQRREAAASRARAKVQVTKVKRSKKRAPETCVCCGKGGHRKANCKLKSATYSSCGKVGHLRAVCRKTNTHEVEKDTDEPCPEVTVEKV